MERIPKNIPYRRGSWSDLVFPAEIAQKYAPFQREAWFSSRYLGIDEAINLLGDREIDCWDGSEKEAHFCNAPPDRPWEWRDSTVDPFIFTSDDQVKVVSEEDAETWWQNILPQLLQEAEREQSALARKKEAEALMREGLAEGEWSALLLRETGEFMPLPQSVWHASNGADFLLPGVKKRSLAIVGPFCEVEGAVTLYKDFLDRPAGAASSEDMEVMREQIDEHKFPYLAFMLLATKEDFFKTSQRIPKKLIESWIEENWTEELGKRTRAKVVYMATLLRRPRDEVGGNVKVGPDQ